MAVSELQPDGGFNREDSEPVERRRPMDEELKAIGAVLRILEELSPAGARRTLVYLADRYRGDEAVREILKLTS